MADVHYIDRKTKKEEKELIYGKIFIELLYGKHFLSRLLSFFILPLVSKIPFASKLYGAFQKSPTSRSKVDLFIKNFHVDTSEFLDPPESFRSFNDFFIRKLKPSCRPIAKGNNIAVLPADGRYMVYQNIEHAPGFYVKGEKFSLFELLQSHALAHKYAQGAMVIARLCPVDYHRFHFPCDGTPEAATLINGPLFSVNPIALRRNINIFSQNKRMLTQIHTAHFGTLLYLEIGATYVGSINQTYQPNMPVQKGDEKGYFSFGGSSLILLFEPFRIEFDADLLAASHRHLEVRAQMGQSLGHAIPNNY